MTYRAKWKQTCENLVAAKRGVASVTLSAKKVSRLREAMIRDHHNPVPRFHYKNPNKPTLEEKAQHALFTLHALGREHIFSGGFERKQKEHGIELRNAGEDTAKDFD